MAHGRGRTGHFGSSESPVIIAHRGFSEEAPENSLAAFHKAVNADADMIELDVRLSADDVFVVFHDKRLDRTSNGHGYVKKMTARELCTLDNGSWFSKKFSHERIPLLSDVLRLARHGVMLNIEIKPDVRNTNGTSAAEHLVSLVKNARVDDRIMFSSFNHKMMKEIKRVDKNFVTGVIYNPITDFRRPPSKLAAAAHADTFICSKYQLNSDVVADARKGDILVYVYGVKTRRDVHRMLRHGVDGIIGDNPALIRKAVMGFIRNTEYRIQDTEYRIQNTEYRSRPEKG